MSSVQKKEDAPPYKEVISWSMENCTVLALLGYTFSYLVYLAAGAVCFMVVEKSESDNSFTKIQLARESVIRRFPNISGEALDAFVSELSALGVNGLRAANYTEDKWTYSQSVFFCVTLLTTIGYGHVSPTTQVGKAFCIMYSAFGIPFTVVLLASWVERLMNISRSIQNALCSCIRTSCREMIVKFFFLIFIAVLISMLFFFLPAYIFQQFEPGWTYLDSLYFCFISLTTVGLGDFVPAKTSAHDRGLYRYGVCVYLIVGVTAVTLLMALLAEFKGYLKFTKTDTTQKPPEIKHQSYGSITVEKTRLLFEDVHYEIQHGCR